MAVQQQSRITLNNLFSDGQRPTGDNFASAWATFLSQKEDGLSFDGTNLVISPNVGLTLGHPAIDPARLPGPGTLRFYNNHVQYFDPVSAVFKNIVDDADAFVSVGDNAVAYSAGYVGIGAFGGAFAPPQCLLEIKLGNIPDPGQKVLLGNLVIHNGTAITPGAYVANNDSPMYALFQDANGTTKINASNAAKAQLSLAIDDVDKFVITNKGEIQLSPTTTIAMNGDVNVGAVGNNHSMTITNVIAYGAKGSPALTVTGDQTPVPAAGPLPVAALAVNGYTKLTGDVTVTGNLVINGNFGVNGYAISNGPPGGWDKVPQGDKFSTSSDKAVDTNILLILDVLSDRRVKKEIRPFNKGLQKLLLFDPFVYKFNGKGGTMDDGKDHIGLIAQDVKKVMPELVVSRNVKLNPEDTEETEVLGLDLRPLNFMVINAIKELNKRVEKLEKTKTNEKRKTINATGAHH
jgi:hypothetical protein